MLVLLITFPLMIILIGEYIGDFILQDRETALNKSKDFKYLRSHLLDIGWVMTLALVPFLFIPPYNQAITLYKIVAFVASYMVIHGIQDWFIWSGYKALVVKRLRKSYPTMNAGEIRIWAEKFEEDKDYAEDKLFYDTIGLDRLLHVLTLIVLYAVVLI